jgi:hypothetical protein
METHSPNQGHVWLRLYNLPGFRVSSQAELPPRRVQSPMQKQAFTYH